MDLIVRDELKRRSIADSTAFARESALEQITDAALRLCPCGRMFTPYRSYQKYCCDAHRVKYTQLKASTYVKKTIITKACKHCSKPFKTNDTKKHYCSDTCYLAFQLTRRKPKEKRVCFNCGETFESSHWAKRYCSETCRLEARHT